MAWRRLPIALCAHRQRTRPLEQTQSRGSHLLVPVEIVLRQFSQEKGETNGQQRQTGGGLFAAAVLSESPSADRYGRTFKPPNHSWPLVRGSRMPLDATHCRCWLHCFHALFLPAPPERNERPCKGQPLIARGLPWAAASSPVSVRLLWRFLPKRRKRHTRDRRAGEHAGTSLPARSTVRCRGTDRPSSPPQCLAAWVRARWGKPLFGGKGRERGTSLRHRHHHPPHHRTGRTQHSTGRRAGVCGAAPPISLGAGSGTLTGSPLSLTAASTTPCAIGPGRQL